MTAAIIDAGRWIDASLSNRQKTAQDRRRPVLRSTPIPT